MSVRRISARFAGALKKSRGAIIKYLVKEYSDAASGDSSVSGVRGMTSAKRERKWHNKIPSSNSSSISRHKSNSTFGNRSITNADARAATKRPAKKETSAPAAPVEKSYYVESGNEAFWALEWVRAELKRRVTRAKENLAKVRKESKMWTRESSPETFTRAAMVYLPPDSAGQAEQGCNSSHLKILCINY